MLTLWPPVKLDRRCNAAIAGFTRLPLTCAEPGPLKDGPTNAGPGMSSLLRIVASEARMLFSSAEGSANAVEVVSRTSVMADTTGRIHSMPNNVPSPSRYETRNVGIAVESFGLYRTSLSLDTLTTQSTGFARDDSGVRS